MPAPTCPTIPPLLAGTLSGNAQGPFLPWERAIANGSILAILNLWRTARRLIAPKTQLLLLVLLPPLVIELLLCLFARETRVGNAHGACSALNKHRRSLARLIIASIFAMTKPTKTPPQEYPLLMVSLSQKPTGLTRIAVILVRTAVTGSKFAEWRLPRKCVVLWRPLNTSVALIAASPSRLHLALAKRSPSAIALSTSVCSFAERTVLVVVVNAWTPLSLLLSLPPSRRGPPLIFLSIILSLTSARPARTGPKLRLLR